MNKEEPLQWNKKYDKGHLWWTQEKELVGKLRRTKELNKEDLVQMVDWNYFSILFEQC